MKQINTQRHLNNLGRLVGHNVGSGLSTYQYILNKDDLTNAYLQMRNDLGYPLMVDSKYRRAIVYNKQGLEKQIENMINNTIEDSFNKLSDLVAQDIANKVDNLLSASTGTIGGGNTSFNSAKMIGSVIGKGLVKGFFGILDSITDTEDYRRR